MKKIAALILLITALSLAWYYGTPANGHVLVGQHYAHPLDRVRVWVGGSGRTFPAHLVATSSQGTIVYSEQIRRPGIFEIMMGGPLGTTTISLQKNGRSISNTASVDLTANTHITTGDEDLDGFFDQVHEWMLQDISTCNGAKGYRSPDTNTIWLRDHTYQGQGFKYWEEDMKSTVDAFLAHQRADGELPDFLCPYRVRATVEADVEYLAVLAAFDVWQATGDDTWIVEKLSALEQAITYSMTAPERWSSPHGLLKRGFTIDFWDFQWGFGSNVISDRTKFGLIVSDNSGLYLAAQRLAMLFGHTGNFEKQSHWNRVADRIKTNANKYLWDEQHGYYKGFVHIDAPVPRVRIDESKLLTLGNTYAMNRGDFVSHEQAKRIIDEYRRRSGLAFQEWFSINPDYGEGKFNSKSQAEHAGGYVNGGIMPLVGGELARAAFAHGFEEYALGELRAYIDMTKKAGGKTYLWYWPDGKPGKDEHSLATDGWGSSAFLAAFVEGLAGIRDMSKEFGDVAFSPRWPTANIHNAKVTLRYGASDGYVAYEEKIEKDEVRIALANRGGTITAHVMLPAKKTAREVLVNGAPVDFKNTSVEQSAYVDFQFENLSTSTIVVKFADVVE